MKTSNSPNSLPALLAWNRSIGKHDIDWTEVLNNLFFSITNNYKLIQFQYKLLMRISTCRYMRYKMNIVKDTDQCSLCHVALETLEHIFFHCPSTKAFNNKLNAFISDQVDIDFRDPKMFHFITCNHSNPIVNFVNLAAKWYISKNFQNSKPLIWDEFLRYIRFILAGEKQNVRVFLGDILSLPASPHSST